MKGDMDKQQQQLNAAAAASPVLPQTNAASSSSHGWLQSRASFEAPEAISHYLRENPNATFVLKSKDKWWKLRCTEEGHQGSSHSAGQPKHSCNKCHKVFASGKALGGHKRAHFNKQPTNDEKEEEPRHQAPVVKTQLPDLNLAVKPEDNED